MDQSKALPVEPRQRADILDILRGFALLGICIANAGYFSLYIFQSPVELSTMPLAKIDEIFKFLKSVLVDGKFYSIFSLLFGIGFSIIFFEKQHQGNRLLVFYRRLFILLIFGVLHALFLWDGDILMFYAMAGIVLPLFRNLSEKSLLTISVLLILSPLLADALKVMSANKLNLSNQLLETALANDRQSGITDSNLSYWLVLNDSYSDLVTWNRSGFWWSWQMRVDGNRLQKVLGMFLIGLAVGKLRMYCKVEDYRRTLYRIAKWGYLIGLPAGIAKAFFESDTNKLPNAGGLLDTLSYTLNVAPLALAYCATIALLHLRNMQARMFGWFKSVGRMALTNYILQAVFGISIYYGIGLGLGSKVGPTLYIPMAVGIFALQVVYSIWWLHHFNFGPLEWIWRQLTYGKMLPLRKS